MGIFNFKNFSISEKVGIAEPSLYYVDPTFLRIWGNFIEFFNSDDRKLEKEEIIDYPSLKPFIIDKELYAKFPVVKIEIELNFKKYTEENYKKEFFNLLKDSPNNNFLVSGSATPFGHRNWTSYTRITNPIKQTDHGIIVKCEVAIDIREEKFNISIYEKGLRDEINATLWHEFNHIYEYYQRFLSTSGPMLKRSATTHLSYSDSNKWGLPKHIYKTWVDYFTYYIYMSESYELNANVQEAGYFISKYGFDHIITPGTQGNGIWKKAKYMENFTYDKFYEKFKDEVSKHYDVSTTDYLLNRLKNMFVSEYNKNVSESPDDAELDSDKLKKMSSMEFINFFGRKINISGKYLIRKISKLKSIE